MASSDMLALPSLRRQNLLAEFSGLKQACPEGVFVTLTPGDPTLWSGVLFVRKGPYASAILRFQISFPDAYPSLPPLVTFSTDMFHPLLTPLTTYTYTTDIQDNGTVSATDDERLPPGGFSLRNGFPAWFGRGKRRSLQPPAGQPPQTPRRTHTPPQSTPLSASATSGSPASSVGGSIPSYMQTHPPGGLGVATTYDVLRYIRSAFDDEAVLDAIPLEAAGHPGAWHAWRAHRRQQGAVSGGGAAVSESTAYDTPAAAATQTTRNLGEWNWEHVWEERVKKGIGASLSDPVLFGGGAGAADDVIRFLNMDETEIQAIKENLKRTLGVTV